MRRISVLMGLTEDDPETKSRLAAFRLGLAKRGWSEGRNVHIDYRFAASSKTISQPFIVALMTDLLDSNEVREPDTALTCRRHQLDLGVKREQRWRAVCGERGVTQVSGE